jgi:hypothetical protein
MTPGVDASDLGDEAAAMVDEHFARTAAQCLGSRRVGSLR